MSTPLFFSFLVSLAITMALIPVLTAYAWRLQFIDVPGDRRAHAAPIAKVGGIAFAVATFAAVLLWAPKDRLILSSLAGGAVIVLFGIWDDRAELPYGTKFLGQILAAAVVMGLAGLRLSSLPFVGEGSMSDWIVLPLTLLVIVAVTNAVNLADGLDGLAGGLSLLSFAGIGFLAYQADESQLLFLTVAVLGGLLGFLRFNTYPARVFMGDAGSQFLGHYLAVAAIMLMDLNEAFYSPLLMLLLWGVPLLDTVGVMGQRILEGRSPFVGDRNHLHYKLLAMGLHHRQAVTVIYTVHGLMVCSACVLRWQSDGAILAVYAGFALPVLFLFVAAKHLPSLPDGLAGRNKPLLEGGASGWSSTVPERLLGLVVLVFLVSAVLVPIDVPEDLGIAAIGSFLVLPAGCYLAPSLRPMMVRASLYLGATLLIYVLERSMPSAWPGLQATIDGFFVAVAVLIMLALRFGHARRFETTPLDYLMVCSAIVISFLPEVRVGDIMLGVLAAKMIVLFLAFELMLHTFAERMAQFCVVSLWVFLMLGLKAWL